MIAHGRIEFVMNNPVSITITDAEGSVLEKIAATRGSGVTSSGELSPTDSFPQSSYVRWTTTNDAGATPTDPSGGGTPGNNMVLVTGTVYDGGVAGGNGNVTQLLQQVDGSTTRTNTMTYDFRDRRITNQGEINFFEQLSYDNLDNTVQVDRYNTTAAGNLIDRKVTQFDDMGQVYQKTRYAVDPATGTVGNGLTDNTWRDASGNVIKSFPAGSQLFTKTAYDSLSRAVIEYAAFGPDSTYADASSVANNTVMAQTETTFDESNTAIQTTNRQRYHNAPASQTGALQDPDTTPNARVTYLALYPDPIGRLVNAADYGTNGGTALVRPSTAPARSTLILVNTTGYDSAGNVSAATDPAGLVICFTFDAAGRESSKTENCTTTGSSSSSSASSSSSSSDDPCAPSDDTNVVTLTTYTPDGMRATLTAINGRTANQTTTWTYGTTLSNSEIASSLLLLSLTFPDSTGGTDVVTYSYNRQGEKIALTDQRGCVHDHVYDLLGCPTNDCVTTLGSGVNGTVRQLATSYEVRGMISGLTSYSSATPGAGTIVNDVALTYNNFGQLFADYQSHTGAVITGTTPNVLYGYADGSANTIRPTTLTYPNGRVLNYDYGTSGGIDDSLSRIASLIDNDGTTHLADYSYLGRNSAVIVSYAQPSVEYILASLTGTNDPVTGDIYAGFDSFSRVKDCRWYNFGSSTDTARLKYGYDNNGNRLWRQDTVAQSLSQTFDEFYSYDGLQRLKDMQRGTLNGTQTGITSPIFEQCWTLDPTNNWCGFREAATGGSWTLNQSRTSNTVNEITGISNSVGSPWAIPAYDAAGNMTTIPRPVSYGGDLDWANLSVDQWSSMSVDDWSNLSVAPDSFSGTYDAWNRLATLVDTSSGDTVQTNQYDARTFRTVRLDYTAGVLSETRHFYYSSNWQSVEERVDTSSTPERQQVWGFRYVDDLVLRDRDTTGGGTLNERLYGLQDANWNMVALIDTSATAQERYLYSPFGWPTFLAGTMSTILAASTLDSSILFTGQRFDTVSNLILFRNRCLHPTLGVFVARDPLGYPDGPNMHAAWFVPNATDPYGTVAILIIPIAGGAIALTALEAAALTFGVGVLACLNIPACVTLAAQNIQNAINGISATALDLLRIACRAQHTPSLPSSRLCSDGLYTL